MPPTEYAGVSGFVFCFCWWQVTQLSGELNELPKQEDNEGAERGPADKENEQEEPTPGKKDRKDKNWPEPKDQVSHEQNPEPTSPLLIKSLDKRQSNIKNQK